MTPDPPRSQSPAPLAPEDYYMEEGLLVFTAAYHLKRGACCGSGCRHCPYEHENVPRPDADQRPTPPVAADDAAGAG